jgi:hypothetical protein
VQLDELLDDRQPQSQTAELARRRSVALPKAFEHMREEFRADPDASVTDRKTPIISRASQNRREWHLFSFSGAVAWVASRT